jgi:hypothetical protein
MAALNRLSAITVELEMSGGAADPIPFNEWISEPRCP